MTNCPRCQKSLDSQAVKCPHCNLELKAFGHPGIHLYRSTDGTILCSLCVYDEDDTCNFPQRPYAQSCTMFRDRTLPLVETEINPYRRRSVGKQKLAIVLVMLILISLLLALS
jgi:hypothetical protein